MYSFIMPSTECGMDTSSSYRKCSSSDLNPRGSTGEKKIRRCVPCSIDSKLLIPTSSNSYSWDESNEPANDETLDDSASWTSIDVEKEHESSSDDPCWDEIQSLLRRDFSYQADESTLNELSIESSTCIDWSPASGRYRARQFPSGAKRNPDVVLNDWRKKMCLWSFRVVDHWRYSRHTVATAMNLLDRYLLVLQAEMDQKENTTTRRRADPDDTKEPWINQSDYQIAAMTCVYLAMKMNTPLCPRERRTHDTTNNTSGSPTSKRRSGYQVVTMQLTSFVELSRGQFTADDICTTEFRILNALKWKVHPVITADFGIALLHSLWNSTNIATPVYHALEELVSYICELTVIHLGNSGTYRWRPHMLASAAVFFAIEFFTEKAMPQEIRKQFKQLHLSSLRATHSLRSRDRSYCQSRNERDEYVEEQTQETTCLQLYLQRTLWSELLCLLEEETQGYQQSHPHNPIANGHSLGIFDMTKAYRIYYQQKYGKSQDSAASCSSTSITSSSSTSQTTSETAEENRVSPSVSPVTTPKRNRDGDLVDNENSSPVCISQNFIRIAERR